METRFLKPPRNQKLVWEIGARLYSLNEWSSWIRGSRNIGYTVLKNISNKNDSKNQLKSGFQWIIITTTMSVLARRVPLSKYGWSWRVKNKTKIQNKTTTAAAINKNSWETLGLISHCATQSCWWWRCYS